MKYYKIELYHWNRLVETIDFLYKKNAKVWLAKNGYELMTGSSSLFRGMDNTKYAKGIFVKVKLEDALITTELI